MLAAVQPEKLVQPTEASLALLWAIIELGSCAYYSNIMLMLDQSIQDLVLAARVMGWLAGGGKEQNKEVPYRVTAGGMGFLRESYRV